MDYRTPNDVALDVDSDEGRLIPNLDEQLPLEVCSSTEGCFIYDAHGAEVGYTYKQDWENDPKGYIVWMAEELRKVYETPVEALKQAAQYEPMFLFYDSEYPTDDVSCKQTNEATLGKGQELPPLNGREPTHPKKSPFTIVTEDHYTEEQPSAIRIVDGETVYEEWFVEHTEDAAKNTELGAEIAWNIRLAYERPWELRD